MMELETKAFSNIGDISDEGAVTAIIATLNTRDLDGDVVMAGAIGNQKVKIQPAHESREPNLGWADVYERSGRVYADMHFYLDTPAGREWFTSIKENYKNAIEQSWSWGYVTKASRPGTDSNGRSV